MSIKTQISADLTTAMKEKNLKTLNILRVLKAEIERNEQTDKGRVELTDGQVVSMVKKFIYNVKETTNDSDEIAVMQKYLPQQLQESEIRSEVLKIKEAGNLAGITMLGKSDILAQHCSH